MLLPHRSDSGRPFKKVTEFADILCETQPRGCRFLRLTWPFDDRTGRGRVPHHANLTPIFINAKLETAPTKMTSYHRSFEEASRAATVTQTGSKPGLVRD